MMDASGRAAVLFGVGDNCFIDSPRFGGGGGFLEMTSNGGHQLGFSVIPSRLRRLELIHFRESN